MTHDEREGVGACPHYVHEVWNVRGGVKPTMSEGHILIL